MTKKKLIQFCIVATILIIACNNQSSRDKKPALPVNANQKKSPGKIEFFEEIHNFGTVKEGEVVVYSFQFRNTGGVPIQLTRAEAGCGCLSVNFSKEEIPSQSVSTVDVVFNSAGEWGNQIKTVEIEVSNGEKKVLKIGAFVENKNFNIDLSN